MEARTPRRPFLRTFAAGALALISAGSAVLAVTGGRAAQVGPAFQLYAIVVDALLCAALGAVLAGRLRWRWAVLALFAVDTSVVAFAGELTWPVTAVLGLLVAALWAPARGATSSRDPRRCRRRSSGPPA